MDIRITEINRDSIIITFKKGCHGFKLSGKYEDRLYYYPDHNFDMDMKTIPAGKWVIENVEDLDDCVMVKLKKSV